MELQIQKTLGETDWCSSPTHCSGICGRL